MKSFSVSIVSIIVGNHIEKIKLETLVLKYILFFNLYLYVYIMMHYRQFLASYVYIKY